MSEEQGEYKLSKATEEDLAAIVWPEGTTFIYKPFENLYHTSMEPEKQPTEVEKAQASVQEWKVKVESFQKELHFAKKNLKVHEWALKKLQEINL